MGYAEMPRLNADLVAPVRTVNAKGEGPFVILCDHASNRIPPQYDDLVLPPSELVSHLAWDPGAQPGHYSAHEYHIFELKSSLFSATYLASRRLGPRSASAVPAGKSECIEKIRGKRGQTARFAGRRSFARRAASQRTVPAA